MTPLCAIATQYDTDKGPTGQNGTLGVFPGHNYTPTYDGLFGGMRYEDLTLCEIGVWSGGSMHLWAEFFPYAKLHGADIDFHRLDEWARTTDRVRWHHCNQHDPADLDRLVSDVGDVLDIVLDDGSHVPEHMTTSLAALWPHTASWYVIEDIERRFLAGFLPQWHAITGREPLVIQSALSPDVVALAWRR